MIQFDIVIPNKIPKKERLIRSFTSESRATTTAEMQGISSASWNMTRTTVKT